MKALRRREGRINNVHRSIIHPYVIVLWCVDELEQKVLDLGGEGLRGADRLPFGEE